MPVFRVKVYKVEGMVEFDITERNDKFARKEAMKLSKSATFEEADTDIIAISFDGKEK